MNISELTKQNVWQLSEEDAFKLIESIQDKNDKEYRSQYMKIIDLAFEIRSISSKRRDLKQSLSILGFKFFKPNLNNSNTIMGLYKRKSPGVSFY